MEIIFQDAALQDIYEYGQTTDKRYKRYTKSKDFVLSLKRKIDMIRVADTFDDLKKISPLHYEPLKYEYSGYSSFRVCNGRVERVICQECNECIKLILLKLDDTHYGNKK